MTEVHFCKLDRERNQASRDRLLQLLPASVRETIGNYQFIDDQDRSMTGFLLLRGLLAKHRSKHTLDQLQRDQYERPFIEGLGDFNITHSGNLIALAYAKNQRLGIDTEQFRELDLSNFTTYMTPDEWADIFASGSPNERFLHYWTIKESLLKAVGLGFRLPLEEIDLRADHALISGKKWHLKRLKIAAGYQVHLAGEIALADIPIFEHDWRNF